MATVKQSSHLRTHNRLIGGKTLKKKKKKSATLQPVLPRGWRDVSVCTGSQPRWSRAGPFQTCAWPFCQSAERRIEMDEKNEPDTRGFQSVDVV